jgi:transposase-like protein
LAPSSGPPPQNLIRTTRERGEAADAASIASKLQTATASGSPAPRLSTVCAPRTDVVAIFPNEAAIVRLVGPMLLEQNDEWAVQRRYVTLETLQALCDDAQAKPRRIAAA